MSSGLADAGELLEMAAEEGDQGAVDDVVSELQRLQESLEKLEFRRMFSGEMDANNCYLDIQAGSGGTEAQDWANILLRMYLRWADQHGFDAEIVELSEGEVAGIKSATVHVRGEYAFGWLRTEIGVHRLVRKSPFDSGNRRHTSFSAVFAAPEIDDDIDLKAFLDNGGGGACGGGVLRKLQQKIANSGGNYVGMSAEGLLGLIFPDAEPKVRRTFCPLGCTLESLNHCFCRCAVMCSTT